MLNRRQLLTTAGTSLAAMLLARSFPAIAQTRPLRIGALISRMDAEGQDELIQPYDQQMRLGMHLAMDEINAAGGILGRRVELVVADDGGSPAPGAAAALGMIQNEGVEALVSGFVTASRRFVERTFRKEGLDIPVIHALWTEGTYCGTTIHVAPTSIQTIRTMIEHFGPDSQRRTFQVSDWSPSQRTISSQFYFMVQAGAVGAALVTTPVTGNSPGAYTGMVRWAHDLKAENFWVSVPRPYAVNLVRQAYASGIGDEFNYFFLDFSEWQASRLPESAEVWTCVPFVASDPDPAVQDFVARARRRSGGDLVTHVAFSHYNAIQAFKIGMEKAGSTSGDAVGAALQGVELASAAGPIVLGPSRYGTMPLYIARGTRQGFEVVRKFDAVDPGSNCT
ncbi:MAG: ABC transporter substrate-binding protein [Alphaproteobacteria bacterium]|jgi:branched-chain amino acid transport system substrate-binding protein|nr:ABC transporter substrate-binding protein [Alphaproteobacteria bacterium]